MAPETHINQRVRGSEMVGRRGGSVYGGLMVNLKPAGLARRPD